MNIFLIKGCKGDRTPMYRAFAPFFEAVRGDRRVTGSAQGERGRLGGIWERSQKKEMAFLWVFLSTTGGLFFFMVVMGDRRVTADVKTALCCTEFSREFNAVSIRWDA